MRKVILVLLLCGLAAGCQNRPVSSPPTASNTQPGWVKWAESYPSWVEPVKPHRIIDNVHYVGSEGLGSYLITTDAGHVLLDGGLPQNAPLIVDSMSTLGFDIRDVRVLINSHAHFDHSGGLAELKSKSGATFLATEGDRSALEGGVYLGDEDNSDYFAPKVMVDQIIGDGSTVTIGGTRLTANLTPGHSRGCTTWTMTAVEGGRDYEVLFFCSASVAGNRLEPPQYTGVVEDYRLTFSKTRFWRPDVPLSNHPNYYFGQLDKIETLDQEGENNGLVFVDRESFPVAMSKLEKSFVGALAKQRDYDTRVSSYQFDVSRVIQNARYLFYLHGKIIEDQGMAAVSDEFGEYQYLDILNRFEDEGFVVISEPRNANTDVDEYAAKVAGQINVLLSKGVSERLITVVGASKGAYIAALVSHTLERSGLNTVLLASCSEGVVRHMQSRQEYLHGRILAVRDASDTRGAGTCQPLFDQSRGVSSAQELVLDTGLSHGVIYRPLDSWFKPVVVWSQR